MLLNGWLNLTATLYIRLNYMPALQRVINARYRNDRWEQLFPKDLNAIAGLILQTANQTITWEKFFASKQAAGEFTKRYSQRCSSEAVECGFKCSACDSDLLEYNARV